MNFKKTIRLVFFIKLKKYTTFYVKYKEREILQEKGQIANE